ncbi:hypothetical protein ACQZ4R_21015 [Agrobacterium vitis]
MSKLTLYTRSFHPDKNFGVGGLGFEGDNRKFSSNPKATARVFHYIDIDVTASEFGAATCGSNHSENAVAKELGMNWILSHVGAEFSQDYKEKRTQPRYSEDPKNITPYRQDGDQSINITVKYAGQNFAFPWASTATGNSVWRHIVPDLDVINKVSIRIDRKLKKAIVSCNISGDSFPNCESFIIDGSGNVLFLASHIRVGTAAFQLPGGRAISMCNTLLEVDWNPDDTFGSQTNVQFCHDYASSGGPFDIASGAMSREKWNAAHTGRDASGSVTRQVEDHIPLSLLVSPAY